MARACLLGVMLLAAGCASSGGSGDGDQTRYVNRGLDRAEASVGDVDEQRQARADANRPPLTVRGTPVGWGTLRPLLAEAAGRDVVDEVVLGMLLEAECRRRGLSIAATDVEAEQTYLIDALTDAGVPGGVPDNVGRLVARVREQRGLGPKRWAGLLERNAMLRALVRDGVVISDEAIARMHDRLYGPDYPARLIVTPTAREAADAIRRVRAGETFGAVAAAVSTDPSADRGGIIDPINPADPTWPLAVRRAVEEMKIGDVSDPIMLDDAYAVLWLERAPDRKDIPAIDAVRDDLERLVRLEQERLLMQREARRLMDEADVLVLDQSLEWARRSGSR